MIRLFAIALCLAQPAFARNILLGVPIQCEIGVDCFIQSYPDMDPSSGAADYTCGALSKNGQSGTSFAIPTLGDVNVLAATPGTVLGLRNDVIDNDPRDPALPDVEGRECGNGVVISHGGGWTTQYCHLAQGSVRVRKGERVGKGAILGSVGLSGATRYPHLEFIVRKGRNAVDPFNPDGVVSCDLRTGQTLWQEAPAYAAAGIIGAGLAPEPPRLHQLWSGTSQGIQSDAPDDVLWTHVFAVKDTDEIEVHLWDGDGHLRDHVRAVIGITAEQLVWAHGGVSEAVQAGDALRATIVIWRDGVDVSRREVTISR